MITTMIGSNITHHKSNRRNLYWPALFVLGQCQTLAESQPGSLGLGLPSVLTAEVIPPG